MQAFIGIDTIFAKLHNYSSLILVQRDFKCVFFFLEKWKIVIVNSLQERIKDCFFL